MARSVGEEIGDCPQRLLSLFKWRRGGAGFPSAACHLFLIPISFPSLSKKSGLMFLYPEHFFCYYFFHFRALPCSRLLLREVLQQLQERRSAGRGTGGRWEPKLCSDKEGRRESCRLRRDPGSAGLPRGSPGPTTRGANIPNAKQGCSPQHSPKGLGMSVFQEIKRRRVWETLSMLHLGLFELDF